MGSRKGYKITRRLSVNKFLVLLLLPFSLTAALAQPAPEPEAVAFCYKLKAQPTQLGKMLPPAQVLSPPETPVICIETVSRYLRHEPQQFPIYKTPTHGFVFSGLASGPRKRARSQMLRPAACSI